MKTSNPEESTEVHPFLAMDLASDCYECCENSASEANNDGIVGNDRSHSTYSRHHPWRHRAQTHSRLELSKAKVSIGDGQQGETQQKATTWAPTHLRWYPCTR